MSLGIKCVKNTFLSTARGRPNPCENHKCKNGGTCDFPADYPICICPSGFGGNFCEYSVPVKNGTCPEIPVSYFCFQVFYFQF